MAPGPRSLVVVARTGFGEVSFSADAGLEYTARVVAANVDRDGRLAVVLGGETFTVRVELTLDGTDKVREALGMGPPPPDDPPPPPRAPRPKKGPGRPKKRS